MRDILTVSLVGLCAAAALFHPWIGVMAGGKSLHGIEYGTRRRNDVKVQVFE